MKKYPTIVISRYFIQQEHIKELQANELVIDYVCILISLEKSSFAYIHQWKNFYKDLAKLSRVDENKVEKIIEILIKHKTFVYKYNKVGYFLEKNLCYDNGKNEPRKENKLPITETTQQVNNNDGDIPDKEWAEMIADITNYNPERNKL